jgi:hypothetical protein
MYPSHGDSDVDAHGETVLPDGRKVLVHSVGYVEGDTNAFCEDEDDSSLTWADTGDELTLEEINSVIEHEGRSYFLHEFVEEFVKWDA